MAKKKDSGPVLVKGNSWFKFEDHRALFLYKSGTSLTQLERLYEMIKSLPPYLPKIPK